MPCHRHDGFPISVQSDRFPENWRMSCMMATNTRKTWAYLDCSWLLSVSISLCLSFLVVTGRFPSAPLLVICYSASPAMSQKLRLLRQVQFYKSRRKMEALAQIFSGSGAFGLVLDFFTKLEREVRVHGDKKGSIANHLKLWTQNHQKNLAPRILNVVRSCTSSLCNTVPVCVASLVAVSVIEAPNTIKRHLHQSQESSENAQAQEHLNRIVSFMCDVFYLKRVPDTHDRSWAEEIINPTFQT